MQPSKKTNFKDLSDKKSSPEYWEKRLTQLNLGKDQILIQGLRQLRQSIISINSLLTKINNDFLSQRQKEDIYNLDFDINAILLILIQRKSFIVDRYKTVLKRDIINRMKQIIGQLPDDTAKQELDKFITQLEYIECNKSNLIGKLQSLI